MSQYLRQDATSKLMAPIEGVQEQPALPGQPVEIGPDHVINPALLPSNYDPRINVIAEEDLQAGDLCYLIDVDGQRAIRKASAMSRTSLATVFVKDSYNAGDPAAAFIHGVLVIPNPGSFSSLDTGTSLYLHPTIPGYVQAAIPTTLGLWAQRVAVITDVTATEVRCYFIGFLDRGRPAGSGVVDTDPIVMAHLASTDNPHATTAEQVGALALALLGVALGVAPLGSDARVPEDYLPLSQWKRAPVRCALTGNVVIATPGATLDSLNMALNDRVLLLGQTDASQNGAYIWVGATSPMERATDADTGAKVWNALWMVKSGTQAVTGWVNTNPSIPTLGSTNLTFTKVIGATSWVNPMVAQGDMIVGGSDGNPSRLGPGTAGQILTMVLGLPKWEAPAETNSLVNPMSAAGDIIVGGTAGAPARLAKGANGQVLTLVSGTPAWIAPNTGMANPLTNQWDIMIGAAGGEPSRLAAGTTGQVLTMVGTAIVWVTPVASLVNPMTTAGDLLIGGSSGVPTRLPKGANGQVLTLVAGVPAWTAPDTGFSNPMTTTGDMMVAGPGGEALRLAPGTLGHVLTMLAGGPGWATAGLFNPMTTAEDLIVGLASGAPKRLAKGSNGQVLTMVGGVVTWTAPVTGMTNPMTDPGDLIVGSEAGGPARMAKGTDGQIMSMVTGLPAWVDNPSLVNPMTTLGDIIIGDVAGVLKRLSVGTNGHVLTVVAGVPAWAVSSGSMANPMTVAGDLIVGGTDGAPTRLAKGADTYVLTMVGGAMTWAAPQGGGGGMTNPMSAIGDVIIGGIDGAPTRLAKGVNGQIFKLVEGLPAWADEGGGGGGLLNPMTALGDLIIGGSGGAATRRAIGGSGQVLTVVSGLPAWADAAGTGGSASAQAPAIQSRTLYAPDPGVGAPTTTALYQSIIPKAIGDTIRITVSGWIRLHTGTETTVTLSGSGIPTPDTAVVSGELGGLVPFGPITHTVVATSLAALNFSLSAGTYGHLVSKNRSLVDPGDPTEYHTMVLLEEFAYPGTYNDTTEIDEIPFSITVPQTIGFSAPNHVSGYFNPGDLLPFWNPDTQGPSGPQWVASVPVQAGDYGYEWEVEGASAWTSNGHEVLFTAQVFTSIRFKCTRSRTVHGTTVRDTAQAQTMVLYPGARVEQDFSALSTVTSTVNQDIDGAITTPGVGVQALTAMVADNNSGAWVLGDMNCIRTLNGSTLTTIAGSTAESGYIDGAALDARFGSTLPSLVMGSNGSILVADKNNNRIRMIDVQASMDVSTLAGCGTLGTVVDDTNENAFINAPVGLAYGGGSEAVYVLAQKTAAGGGLVVLQILDGNTQLWFDPTVNWAAHPAVAIAVDSTGLVFVITSDLILCPEHGESNWVRGDGVSATIASGGDNATLVLAVSGWMSDWDGSRVVYSGLTHGVFNADDFLVVMDNGCLREVDVQGPQTATQTLTLSLTQVGGCLGITPDIYASGSWCMLRTDNQIARYGAFVYASPFLEDVPLLDARLGVPDYFDFSYHVAIGEACPVTVNGINGTYSRVLLRRIPKTSGALWTVNAYRPSGLASSTLGLSVSYGDGISFDGYALTGVGSTLLPTRFCAYQTVPLDEVAGSALVKISAQKSLVPAPSWVLGLWGGCTSQTTPYRAEFPPKAQILYGSNGWVKRVNEGEEGDFSGYDEFVCNEEGNILEKIINRRGVSSRISFIYDEYGVLLRREAIAPLT